MMNLTIDELRMIAKERNIRGYQNISKKQLEDKFPAPFPRSKKASPLTNQHIFCRRG